MMSSLLILLILVFASPVIDAVEIVRFTAEADLAEANHAFRVCQSRQLTRNAKDIYPNPADCHSYYRCYFANATHSVGVRHHCPPRHFWSVDGMKCLPEGRMPCMDQCRNGTVAEHRCYAMPHNCAKFYKCVDTISEPVCCPNGTRFNPTTCVCQIDPRNSCNDRCTLPQAEKTPAHLTTLEDVPRYNTTHCEDKFGNILQALSGHPESFLVVSLSKSLEAIPGVQQELMASGGGNTRNKKRAAPPTEPPESQQNRFSATCPKGSHFDVRSCRCRPRVGTNNGADGDISREASDPATHDDGEATKNKRKLFARSRECSLYLPFDEDLADHSRNNYFTFLYDNVEQTPTFFARGSGSLLLQGGRLEISQFSEVDFRDSASFCLFFQCNSEANDQTSHFRDPFACVAKGGLLSNRLENGADYSISIAAMPNDQVTARITFEHPDYVASINSSVNFLSNYGFNQACVIYDGSYVTLYVNNILMAKAPAAGFIRSSTNPYLIGTDGLLGEFHGYIDEVLACRHALTQAEVNAHFKGQDALRKARLIP